MAEVEGRPISQQDFDHWLGVVGGSAAPEAKKKPAPPKKGSPEYERSLSR